MALSTDAYVDVANDLIETCKDGEKGFRESAEHLRNPSIRSKFLEFAQQRADYARELQSHLSSIGQTAETGGSASGALHRGWMDLKSAITGRTDKAIIDEAERGEDVAVEHYQKAMAKDVPSDLKALIERQYRGIQEGHSYVSNLKHTSHY